MIQKSTREGFGLTVSEALWKARPFIGGDVGGIPLQVEDGETGLPRVSSPRSAPTARCASCASPIWASVWAAAARSTCASTSSRPASFATGCVSSESDDRQDAARARLEPRTRDVRAGRGRQPQARARRRRPGHRAHGTGPPPRRRVGGVRDDRRGPRGEPPRTAGAASRWTSTRPATGCGWWRATPRPTTAFYNVVANPMLWFIQHYLWDLSNAPDIRRHEVDAYEKGYCRVNEDLAEAVLEEVDGRDRGGDAPRLPPLHSRPSTSAGRGPTSSSTTSCTSRGRSPTRGACSPPTSARTSTRASSPTTSSPSTRAPTNATSCSAAATCSTSTWTRRRAWCTSTAARCGCAPTRCRSRPRPSAATAQRPAVHEYGREILRRRREHLILRVDRADLSKNILRGFTAFDLFLEQHPEFTGST